ncbi:MAG: ABC transporter permease subunit, partial [Planctomycetota bacterium]|nr:ABC transporter permease subunit [Planctomycetota bacterium]
AFFSSIGVALAGGLLQLTALVALVPPAGWRAVALGLLATLLRVAAALALALLWTVPAGVAIGSSPRLARVVQPLVQVAASVPATALFPIVLLVLLRLPRGLELAAVVLMLMGTQWYLLFNVIAGAAAIPQDLRHTASALRLGRVARWRALVLPAIFPHLVTGAVTAAGGAWNASIVAEYVRFGERTERTVGIGAVIADATARGDFPLLAGATVALVGAVALLNLLVWRRLYRVAEDRFRLE